MGVISRIQPGIIWKIRKVVLEKPEKLRGGLCSPLCKNGLGHVTGPIVGGNNGRL